MTPPRRRSLPENSTGRVALSERRRNRYSRTTTAGSRVFDTRNPTVLVRTSVRCVTDYFRRDHRCEAHHPCGTAVRLVALTEGGPDEGRRHGTPARVLVPGWAARRVGRRRVRNAATHDLEARERPGRECDVCRRGRRRGRAGRAHLPRRAVRRAVDLRRRDAGRLVRHRLGAGGGPAHADRPRPAQRARLVGRTVRAFDPSTIEQDKETLTLYYTDAELQQQFDALPQWIHDAVDGYVDGSNAYVTYAYSTPALQRRARPVTSSWSSACCRAKRCTSRRRSRGSTSSPTATSSPASSAEVVATSCRTSRSCNSSRASTARNRATRSSTTRAGSTIRPRRSPCPTAARSTGSAAVRAIRCRPRSRSFGGPGSRPPRPAGRRGRRRRRARASRRKQLLESIGTRYHVPWKRRLELVGREPEEDDERSRVLVGRAAGGVRLAEHRLGGVPARTRLRFRRHDDRARRRSC